MKKILIIILFAFVLIPSFSMAADDKYTLLAPLPCIEGTGNGSCASGNNLTEISLGDYIGYIFKFAIALAAFLAVLMIMYGGFVYMTSESPFGKKDGMSKVQDAIAGLLMVLASYLILATIDPRLVQINTSIDPIVIKKVDLAALEDFQKQLTSDLTDVSANSQKEIAQLNSENQTKLSRIDELELRRLQDGELSLDDEVELARLNSQANTNNAKIIKEVAIDKSATIFSNVINNPSAVAGTYLGEAYKIDEIITNEKIEQMKSLGDLQGAQKLEMYRNFFHKELYEQGNFDGNIRLGIEKYIREDLNKQKINLAQMNSVGPASDPYIAKIKTDEKIAPLYLSILNSRIKRAENAIK